MGYRRFCPVYVAGAIPSNLLRRVDASSGGRNRLEHLAQRYFNAWNAKDSSKLELLLSSDAHLRDWEMDKTGSASVVRANMDIWKRVPGIFIEVLTMHVSNDTRTICAEIVVKLSASESLKVVDVITFDSQNKIASIRAYKG